MDVGQIQAVDRAKSMRLDMGVREPSVKTWDITNKLGVSRNEGYPKRLVYSVKSFLYKWMV